MVDAPYSRAAVLSSPDLDDGWYRFLGPSGQPTGYMRISDEGLTHGAYQKAPPAGVAPAEIKDLPYLARDPDTSSTWSSLVSLSNSLLPDIGAAHDRTFMMHAMDTIPSSWRADDNEVATCRVQELPATSLTSNY